MLTENQAWLVGIIAGDGSLSGRMVRIWNTEKYVIEKAKRIILNEFKQERIIVSVASNKKDNHFKRRMDVIELRVNSVKLKEEIKNLLFEIKATSNLETIFSFLRGVFDAEGSVDFNGNIVLWQRKNKKGMEIIRTIKRGLETSGINFRVWNNKNFFIISIPGNRSTQENLEKFRILIGFSHPKKDHDLTHLITILKSKKKPDKKEVLDFIKLRRRVKSADLINKFLLLRSEAHRLLKRLHKEGLVKRIDKHTFEII